MGCRAYAIIGAVLGLLGMAWSAEMTASMVELNSVKPLSTEAAKTTAGGWNYVPDRVWIAGAPYDGYGQLAKGETVTLNVAGYDHFTAYIGVTDSVKNGDEVIGQLLVRIDNKPYGQLPIRSFSAATYLDVPVSGAATLTLACSKPMIIFAEPRLFTGTPWPMLPLTAPLSLTPNLSQPRPSEALTAYSLDYTDYERAAKAFAQFNLSKETNIGMLSFSSTIPAPMAEMLMDDLATIFGKAGYHLVERSVIGSIIGVNPKATAPPDFTSLNALSQSYGMSYFLYGSITDRGESVVIDYRLLGGQGKAFVGVYADQIVLKKISAGVKGN